MADIDLTDAERKAQEAIRSGNIPTIADEDSGEFTMRILTEGVSTIDGRYFTEGAVSWREPPLSLLYLTVNGDNGHKGAKVGATITKIWRDGPDIWGSGHFASNADGQELRKLIREGTLTGISADVGGASSEFEADGEGRQRQRISKGTIMGVTVLPMQAFSEGRVVVTAAAEAEAITAAAAPIAPKAEWFQNPGFDRLTPHTVTDEGHVFGHLAGWGTCHIGRQQTCLEPPRSATGYANFMLGEVVTDDGTKVATGRIAMDTGHASLGLSAASSVAHYDNTGTAVADIVVGEDEFGIWYSGAVRPDVSEEKIRAFRASSVSGDWRTIQGNLELVALLAVNTPGFPVPRPQASLVASAEAEERLALVAAGLVVPEADEYGCGCGGSCGGCGPEEAEEAEAEAGEEAEFGGDGGCGCGGRKPKIDVEFNPELAALDLKVLEARIGY